jgi:HEAT repeat protein
VSFCDRIPNGNTFFAHRSSRFGEVDGEGKEVYTRELKPSSVSYKRLYPWRVRSGLIGCLEEGFSAKILELDAASEQVVRSMPTDMTDARIYQGHLEVRPDGGYLLAGLPWLHRSTVNAAWEIGDGKLFPWEVAVPECRHAVRLRDGNTLIAGGGRLLEVDPEGRLTWEVFFEDETELVRPCLTLVRLGFDAPRPEKDLDGSPDFRLKGLKRKESWARRRAVHFLGEAGPRAADAIPTLTALLDEKDEVLREAARVAISQIRSEATKELRETARKGKDPKERMEAIIALKNYRRHARVIAPVLIESMESDPDPKVRGAAANALGAMRLEAKTASLALAKSLATPDPDLPIHIFYSLLWLRQSARPAASLLLDHLNGKDLEAARTSAHLLGCIDKDNEKVLPALIKALKVPYVSLGAVRGLYAMGPKAKGAVPALMDALEKPVAQPTAIEQQAVRDHLLGTLGSIGPGARQAIPRVLAIAQSDKEDEEIRRQAVFALGKIGLGDKDIKATLEAMARGKDRILASAAEQALQDMEAADD